MLNEPFNNVSGKPNILLLPSDNMPITREIRCIHEFKFSLPMRAIFSGSSQSGKTHMIGEMLKNQEDIFSSRFDFIKYYYPTFLDEAPVDYHDFIETPISYASGFPTKAEVLAYPKNTLMIIDDQSDTAVKSDLVSQIFKVISGKKNLSIILVTQNYFMQGRHSREIRNSCNYVGLFRNCCDDLLNSRVATAFGLKAAYAAAEKDIFDCQIYPFIFIDQTQRGQISQYRLYTKIIGSVREAYSKTGMKGYILSEDDFKAAFEILSESKGAVLAIRKNENKTRSIQKLEKTPQSDSVKSSESNGSDVRHFGGANRTPKSNKFAEIRKRLASKRRKLKFSE